VAEALQKWGLPGWLFAIYFVYPIPHTIALRNLFLLAGLVVCLGMIVRHYDHANFWQPLNPFRISGWILVTLTLWLLLQSSFISPYPRLALDMLRGDWFIELLVAFTGVCAVLACQYRKINRLIVALVFALFAHIVLLLGYQAWLWAHTGSYPFGATPFAQKDYHSMLVTTLIALLLADLASLAINRRSALMLSWPAILSMLIISCVATATLLARNAVIITLIMLFITSTLFLFPGRKRFGRWAASTVIALLLAASIVSWFGLRNDSRWQGFSEAASAAFDTQNNLAWLNAQEYPLPLMKNGLPVEESAYSRLAWAKVGLEQVARYPLGLGYGHKAFGWAVNRSYDVKTGHESSHSGLLDFTLANGIPGLILWLALSGTLIAAGWRAFREQHSPVGLALAFTVIAYLVRCLLDGHLSGFRFEMYAFLVGALVMAQTLETKPCN
jgi:hypothetical protein